MPLRILISLNLLLLAMAAAGAQPADDFFHAGAQSYLSNNIPSAKQEVAAGLKLYPDDTKLKKLDELLNQRQQSQDNQQNKQDQQKKDQQSKNDEQKEDQDKKDQKQQQQEQQQAQDQKREAEKKQQQNSAGKPEEQKDEQRQAAAATGQMTPQQAKQLLESLKQDEQLLWFKPTDDKPASRNRPFKDW